MTMATRTGACDSMMLVLRRLRCEQDGQDIVEYALLAAFLGIAGWAVLMTLTDTMGTTYASWIDPNVGVPALWNPPEPGAGGS